MEKNMESEIWMSFQTSRGANATLFLCVIIASHGLQHVLPV